MSEFFEFGILYQQIGVHDKAVSTLPGEWRLQHVDQGFTWRPGSVAFATLRDCCRLRMEVRQAKHFSLRPDVVRAIVVPFDVSSAGQLEITDTADVRKYAILPGRYALVFESGYVDEETEWCRLTFASGERVEPEILRADEGLSPTYPLLMEADPIYTGPDRS